MTVDIFLKSYAKDFKLLHYSLLSIKKYVKNYNNLIILIPEAEKNLFDTRDLPDRTLVHYVPEYGSGYMFQQLCKIQAYKYSFAEFILFSDSDLIYDHDIDCNDLVKDGKPEILYTHWTKVGDAICWKYPTEQLIGQEVPFEYMRRHGLIYYRQTLININEWKPDLEQIIMSSDKFSEFNLIGAYAWFNERERYSFVNTDDWQYVRPIAEQLWSYYRDGNDEVHKVEKQRALDIINKISQLCLTPIFY